MFFVKFVGPEGSIDGGLVHFLFTLDLPIETVKELEKKLQKKEPKAVLRGPVPLMAPTEEGTGDSILLTSGIKTPIVYEERTRQVRTDNFRILQKSPYDELNPIPSNISLPDGLIFRIQLGAYSKPVSDNNFKGLSPVSYEAVNGKIWKGSPILMRRTL